MIVNFRHKGLKRFFETGDGRGINAEYLVKVEAILSLLHVASSIENMDVPGFRTHELHGNKQGIWSVTVRANWRITFRFEDGDAFEVDLVDYHGK
jgi:proteic killer suppression protein